MSFIVSVLGFLTSGGLSAITQQLADAHRRKLDAETSAAALEADLEITALKARRDIMLREQDHWVTRWVRPAFALPFILYNAKIIIWDKILGLGTTDPLSTEMLQIEMLIIGFYFLARGVEKAIRSTRR